MSSDTKQPDFSHHSRKYKPWMDAAIVKVAEEGGLVAKMCRKIGIGSRVTFYKWLNEYPTFGQAYEAAQLASLEFYEDLLLKGATGQLDKFNFNAVISILNNKFRSDYSRSTHGSNTEINIGQINSLESMDASELEAKIAKLTKKLGFDGPRETQLIEQDSDE